MADPLSVAASVAGLVSLGGALAKTLYSFIASVVDAPADVQSLLSGLYSLNSALCHVQTFLLDSRFNTTSEQRKSLEDVLTNCVRIYSQLESTATKANEVLEGRSSIKKLWTDVKWVFNDEAIDDLVGSLEREKSTLVLIINTLNLHCVMTINTQMQHISLETRRNTRMLRDILVTLQWDNAAEMEEGQDLSGIPDTVMRATSVYEMDQISGLFSASCSTLGLAVSNDIADDTVSAIFMPDATSNIPISLPITHSCRSGEKQDVTTRSTTILDSLAALIQSQRQTTASKTLGMAMQAISALPQGVVFSAMITSLASISPLLMSRPLLLDALQEKINHLVRRMRRLDSIIQHFVNERAVSAGLAAVEAKLSNFATITKKVTGKSGLRIALETQDPFGVEKAWKELCDEMQHLEEDVNFCFMQRMLHNQTIVGEHLSALAARESFPTTPATIEAE